MSKVVPLYDRVIIEKIEQDSVTKSGIIIPDQAKEKPVIGTVLSVGPGRLLENGNLIPCRLKEGDRVLFGRYSGSEVQYDGRKMLLLKEDDVFAVVVDE